MKCETCKFARHFPDPGPEPEPYKPSGFWEKLFFTEGSDLSVSYWHFLNYKYVNLVRCHLLPESINKQKYDFCSHYKPK